MLRVSKDSRVHKIIFDNSGSISGAGKDQLLLNTLRFCRQYQELNNIKEDVYYYQLKDLISEIKIETNIDIVIEPASGKINESELTQWIMKDRDIDFLWITDGYFDFSKEDQLSLSKCENITLVALGCDADIDSIESLRNNNFKIYDIGMALDLFFMKKNINNNFPLIVDENIFSDVDESDDEW